MRTRAAFLVIALFTLAGTVAHADDFTFSFGSTGDDIIGSGTLTGTLTSPGDYTITAIQGTTSYPGSANLSIAGLLPSGDFESNNNQLTLMNGSYGFDGSGLSYELSDGTDVNLYTDPTFGDGQVIQTTGGTIDSQYVPYSVAATTSTTPEPGSIVLLGTGLLGALGVARKRLQA